MTGSRYARRGVKTSDGMLMVGEWSADAPPVVAVHGISSTHLLWQWTAAAAPGLRIVVIEPREKLGSGLAYSAADPDHRLNVPDVKMTLRTDRPDDYARWLGGRAAPADIAPNGDVFTARATFGAYVADQMAPLLANGRVTHLRQTARSVEATGR